MIGKKWWQSKTIWVNVLTTIGTVGATLVDALPAAWGAKIVAVLGLVNVVLRAITSEPVTK